MISKKRQIFPWKWWNFWWIIHILYGYRLYYHHLLYISQWESRKWFIHSVLMWFQWHEKFTSSKHLECLLYHKIYECFTRLNFTICEGTYAYIPPITPPPQITTRLFFGSAFVSYFVRSWVSAGVKWLEQLTVWMLRFPKKHLESFESVVFRKRSTCNSLQLP